MHGKRKTNTKTNLTQFRVNSAVSSSQVVWSVEYQRNGEDEWYDLFEDPSRTICQIIADALTKVNPDIITDAEERKRVSQLLTEVAEIHQEMGGYGNAD